MRRWLIAALIGGVSSGLAAQPAVGAVVNGTARADRLRGTGGADAIYGRGGADRLVARAGPDLVNAGPGRDVVVAGPGDDRIAVQADRARDSVACGPGRDVVTAERTDLVATDCEVVSRQLSRDPYVTADGQHETQVEPHGLAQGTTIVTAFQTGRFSDGGAANIGWSTSRDAGRTWTSGFLGGTTIFSGGTREVVSDPVVAYDALHRTWLIASLGVSRRLDELLVSRSSDGVRWSLPAVAVRTATEELDKEWLACDNWPTSPQRGRCYLSYLNVSATLLLTTHSDDGGRTWSTPVVTFLGVAGSAMANGAVPVPRPDGTLVVVFAVFASLPSGNFMASARSADGGISFEAPIRISPFIETQVTGMRAPPLPAADVDGRGRLYATWSDCSFSFACEADVSLTTSADGRSWTRPVRVPVGVPDSGHHRFVPAIGVDHATGGSTARVAIAYHSLALPEGCDPVRSCPGVDVDLIASTTGGETWAAPQRLSAEPMPLSWMPEAGFGRMLGDYIAVTWVGGRPMPIYSLASTPVRGRFRQAIFAGTRTAGALRVR